MKNQTNSLLFLNGFTVRNNVTDYIDIYCKETLTDHNLNIKVTTSNGANHVRISQISMTVLLIN
jgi:hypothetical protein